MTQQHKKYNNYAFVMALSKRAREIVENHEDSTKEYTVKPVKMAEDEFKLGKFVIVDADEEDNGQPQDNAQDLENMDAVDFKD